MKNAGQPNTPDKVTKQKHIVNTVKKDNGQRGVSKFLWNSLMANLINFYGDF